MRSVQKNLPKGFKDKNLLFMGLGIAKVWLYVKEHLGTSCCMSRNAFVNNE